MGLISMIKTSKKILRAFNLPLLPVPPAQISLSTQDEDYLLFKICKIAIYQFAICMTQILPEHGVRGTG